MKPTKRNRTSRPRLVRYDPKEKYTPAEIKALRRRVGLTYRMFADALGVHQQTVVYWESGFRTPERTTMILLRLIDLYPELFIARDAES